MGARWWIFAVLLLAPDLTILAYLAGPKAGAISYNFVHSYVFPSGSPSLRLPGRLQLAPFLCIWTAHVGMDRLLGYGLKYPSHSEEHTSGDWAAGRVNTAFHRAILVVRLHQTRLCFGAPPRYTMRL